MAELAPFLDFEAACTALEALRPVWQAECAAASAEGRGPDAYTKLRWKGLQEEVQRQREFWRSVDMTVELDDPAFGFVDAEGRGRGRRAGHRVHTADNDGSAVEGG